MTLCWDGANFPYRNCRLKRTCARYVQRKNWYARNAGNTKTRTGSLQKCNQTHFCKNTSIAPLSETRTVRYVSLHHFKNTTWTWSCRSVMLCWTGSKVPARRQPCIIGQNTCLNSIRYAMPSFWLRPLPPIWLGYRFWQSIGRNSV